MACFRNKILSVLIIRECCKYNPQSKLIWKRLNTFFISLWCPIIKHRWVHHRHSFILIHNGTGGGGVFWFLQFSMSSCSFSLKIVFSLWKGWNNCDPFDINRSLMLKPLSVIKLSPYCNLSSIWQSSVINRSVVQPS